MDHDSDHRSLLARAMRLCDERGLRELAELIEAEFDARDQRRLDDAVDAKQLVAWKSGRGFRRAVHHLAESCGEGPTACSYFGQARQVRTACLQFMDYATVWPTGKRQFDRDGDDENDKRYAKFKIAVTCKKCQARVAKRGG